MYISRLYLIRTQWLSDHGCLIRRQWFGDYRKLEIHHGYVQWLFPIHEEGMNHLAQVLQTHEKEAMVKVGASQVKPIAPEASAFLFRADCRNHCAP